MARQVLYPAEAGGSCDAWESVMHLRCMRCMFAP